MRWGLTTKARCVAGAALLGLAAHRSAAALGLLGVPAAPLEERRLQGAQVSAPISPGPRRGDTPEGAAGAHAASSPAEQGRGRCLSVNRGLPVKGVRYVPHLVGEPYPHPESKPWAHYTEVYAELHKRDLPLIGEYVAADTLSLRPWPTEGPSEALRPFMERMHDAGLCKVVPTFHAAKYYGDMLRQGFDQPKTDPSSPFAVDFARFGATVVPTILDGIELVGWTVDLSLDLSKLLPLVGLECATSKVMQDKAFQKYMMLLNAIHRWVHPANGASVAPALADAPFFLPMDVSRISWTEPDFQTKLVTFLNCMSTSVMNGGWSNIFTGQDPRVRARWLLFFSVPIDDSMTYNFRLQLQNVTAVSERILVMAGTQALKIGGANPINTVNLMEDTSPDDDRYRRVYTDYLAVANETGKLDGFIYDEWMDDWDRGTRGPWFLAAGDLEEMKDQCPEGGRFSHDINGCSQVVGNNGQTYPEFFGLAATSSQVLKHCAHPRFTGSIFGQPGRRAGERIDMRCARMVPSLKWVAVSMFLLVLVMVVQVGKMALRWLCREGCLRKVAQKGQEEDEEPEEPKEVRQGYVTVSPADKELCGNHQIELQSTQFRSNEEAGWWLWTHVATQMAILERQVQAEVATHHALRTRAAVRPPGAGQKLRSASASPPADAPGSGESDGTPSTPGGEDVATRLELSHPDDIAKAMQIIHRRALEGFAAWCSYVAGVNRRSFCRRGLSKHDLSDLAEYARAVEENSERPASRLFAEALLLRTMESLGEQILQCPERISYLLFHIFQEAGGLEDVGPATFSIDLDKLQDGLPQMSFHSNPYVRLKMPDGTWSRGLNFDDINESGIQCREGVAKTYKEPASLMVLVDFVLCYRVPLMIKMYTLTLSGYLYLGSLNGDDISTSHNGGFFTPKWLRINYIQYTALIDAIMWAGIEAVLVVYVAWQRWPSLCRKSPGIPGIHWLVSHVFNLSVSVLGGLWVWSTNSFERKPWECAQSDDGICEDVRTTDLGSVLQSPLVYWSCRAGIFMLMNLKHVPIFLYGTPDSKVRQESGRGFWRNLALDLRVNLAWVCMLGVCVFTEVFLLLPTMKGLDWSTTCGMDMFGKIGGLPFQTGVCSEPDQALTFGCVACVSSVSAGWGLVLLGSLVDIYFVFYFASAFVGSVMGHKRHLNDLKNTSLPIDLREHQGREALLFERTFGPGWQQIWRVMVKSLLQESLISPKQATGLVQAAGISLDGEAPPTQREKAQKPIHLTRFPHLAGERLAFFFQSLKWIEHYKPGPGMGFEPSTDALTGTHFDPGSIPSLTQIIPAYNEVVIPSVEFLNTGADPEEARNSSPDDQPGLGDLTVPPQGDGINTNLAFMISQFPDEWVFLTKRLYAEGLIESSESQELYRNFTRGKLNAEVVPEVRLWAALRMQSVAKTVIGALQYGRALASLPKIKEHYARYPEKRIPEDHVEVILAHQTYGHPEGNPKNDEAVQLLLERYCDDAVYLVFDLKKGSSVELWRMAETFLTVRGGYALGSFEQASVKCRWDKARRGLRVLEVLPRKFPLRLGQGDFKTQGKACNQLNGLRFASGHYVQALDCNMGTFIGEGFKVPYVLRMFMPLDKEDRTAPRCRYLGFREYIYTGREGAVGKCHAAAEWTFGTIYQRFLSGMGCRMHYGHPDFLDGFWARNRGGMSKSSPVVNLSEDIFAGFNVRMREEASPHIDALEFEKGREATFNAASNFFSKISGGSVAVLRSRDNHLLCERIGLLHSLSFYFTSVAFYTSNLLVDISIYLYVVLFIFFNLAGLGPGELSALGSTFSTEWIVSMGLVTLVPQLCEMVLEHGAMHAAREVFGGLLAATFFYIFQNKNIASSMREGALTGIARYFFTGRPMANQHQTWKDIYVTYWKSHYKPALCLAMAYTIYCVLAEQNHGKGKLPMVLVVVSFVAWIITPILFSPFPRWNLIQQDLREFNSFITGGAGAEESDIPEVVARGKKGTVRSLYECGLADEIAAWTEPPLSMLLMCFASRVLIAVFLAFVLPAEITDFLPVFLVALSFSWVVVLGYFVAGLNNVFLVISFLIWPACVPIAHLVIGTRFGSPTPWARMPEYVISLAVFLFALGLAKDFVLISCRTLHSLSPCLSRGGSTGRLHECIRVSFVYFFVHQLHIVEAYIVLIANTLVSVVLAAIDQVFCNAHTWFLLNNELARTKHGERYMEKATFYELDGLGYNFDLCFSDSESEASPRTMPARGREEAQEDRQWP